MAVHESRQRKCSYCREPGHNVKTCPKANACPQWDEAAFSSELEGIGMSLGEVVEFLTSKGRPHPSQMQPNDRAKMVPWLAGEGSKMLANYFINKSQEA